MSSRSTSRAAEKAHPDDDEGKRLMKKWISFIRSEGVRSRVVFQYGPGSAVKPSAAPARENVNPAPIATMRRPMPSTGPQLCRNGILLVRMTWMISVCVSRLDQEHGTGFGLSLVHRIMADHGWSIRVRSRPGQTCFTLRLPAAT